MVDIKLIKDTITELLEANVDKDTINTTLREIGVDQADIDKYYQELTSKGKETPVPKTEIKTSAKTEQAINTKPKTTTEELEKATNDVIDSAPEIEPASVFKAPIKTVEVDSLGPEIKNKISDLETQITEIKAQLNGLTKIMKDILEENRNILNKIK